MQEISMKSPMDFILNYCEKNKVLFKSSFEENQISKYWSTKCMLSRRINEITDKDFLKSLVNRFFEYYFIQGDLILRLNNHYVDDSSLYVKEKDNYAIHSLSEERIKEELMIELSMICNSYFFDEDKKFIKSQSSLCNKNFIYVNMNPCPKCKTKVPRVIVDFKKNEIRIDEKFQERIFKSHEKSDNPYHDYPKYRNCPH